MALTDILETPLALVLFFIIETSGRMSGHKINAINTAVREVIPEIRDISNGNADALIKIAVLQFSSGIKWLTPNGPIEADKFNWTNLNAGCNADFGAACRALNEKLSEKAFMTDVYSPFAPLLFLFSDGKPTDDWKKELDNLKQNEWFRAAFKLAIPVGADADRDVLGAFTGTRESILEDFNPSIFKALVGKCVNPADVSASRDDDDEPGPYSKSEWPDPGAD